MCRKIAAVVGTVALIILLGADASDLRCQSMHPFNVKDDIELSHFVATECSPDGKWFLATSERASLQDGNLHDTVRIYSVRNITGHLHRLRADGITPTWIFERVVGADLDTEDDGEAGVSDVKWTSDSTSFAFTLRVSKYEHILFLANIKTRTIRALSPPHRNVLGFDIRTPYRYVFTLASHAAQRKLELNATQPARDGTGRDIGELAFPEDSLHQIQRSELWAAMDGPAKPVRNNATQRVIELFSDGNESLSLSPDGSRLLTLLPYRQVTQAMVAEYPPPYPRDPYGLKAHVQDLDAPADYWSYVSQWVCIDLKMGHVTSLTNAPAALRAGWIEVQENHARWSSDGSTVIVPGTYLNGQTGEAHYRPCIAAISLAPSHVAECIKLLKRQLPTGFEEGWRTVSKIQLIGGRSDLVELIHVDSRNGGEETELLKRIGLGKWTVVPTPPSSSSNMEVTFNVEQSYDHPPLLVARDRATGSSVVVLDPNPQLRLVKFGQPGLYKWSDGTGLVHTAILYKPIGYRRNVRYPLVIQTHGYWLDRFLPSGSYPSAFVAQELASSGIMVLQMQACSGDDGTPLEAPCAAGMFESAVDSLVRQGDVDLHRVGIIGFSRTVYHVLAALSSSRIHFRAASVTDGITMGYWNYLEAIRPEPSLLNTFIGIYGVPPQGPKITQWLDSSPIYNLENVMTPIRIVASRGRGVVDMWEPYALLQSMHKPVDFIVLNTDEHVIVDPMVRLAAQGGNVEWFRFWLQGYEDSTPLKVEQYRRWENFCDLQKTPYSEELTYCTASKRRTDR